jgi:hypothetical protein
MYIDMYKNIMQMVVNWLKYPLFYVVVEKLRRKKTQIVDTSYDLTNFFAVTDTALSVTDDAAYWCH